MSEKKDRNWLSITKLIRIKLVHLAIFVDQFKGKAVPAKAEPGEFAVINLSVMTPNGVLTDDLKTFSEERRKFVPLEDGDVLLLLRELYSCCFRKIRANEVVASSNITSITT